MVDPTVLLAEIDQLKAAGLDISRLLVSDRAHVIMPYHRMLDDLEETDKGRFCCKSRFALVNENSAGRGRGFRVKM